MLNSLVRAACRLGGLARRFRKTCGEQGLRVAVEKACRSIARLPGGAAVPVQPAAVYEYPPEGAIPVFHPEPVDLELKRRQTLALQKTTREAIAFVAADDSPFTEAVPRATAEIAHLLRHFCNGCRHARETMCTLTPPGPPEKPGAPFFRILGDDAGRCPAGRWPAGDAPQVTRMNLAYFILPVRHPARVWQWNVAELLKRIDIFNGRRIITIATVEAGQQLSGMEVDSAATVIDAFAGHDVEFRLAPNDPDAHEARHFIAALRELASTDETEALFYAHAKGVTRQNQRPVRAWTSAMYHHNLDRIDEVRDALRRWPCAGIGKHYGLALPFLTGKPTQTWGEAQRPWHGWHFSGTFWWVRHDALFSIRDWDRVELYRYTPEKFLANYFTPDQAYCLVHDDIRHPHDPLTWHDLGITARAA